MALAALLDNGADGGQGEHAQVVDNSRPTGDIDLPDDLLDQYGVVEDGKSTGRAPATKPDSTPDEDDEDTPDGDSDSELDSLFGTDEKDEGEGEEDDEELDGLLGEKPKAPVKEEGEESFVTTFDRDKFLKKYKDNPDVLAAYKSLLGDYTRGKQALATQEKEWQGKLEQAAQQQEQFKEFQTRLRDDKGMTDFLINVALHRPKVFEKAFDDAVALSEDEGKREQYLKDKKLEEREAKLQRDEQQRQKREQGEYIQWAESLTQRAAGRLGLKGEAQLDIAEQYVANAIRDAHAEKRRVTGEEVVAAVKLAAKRLGVTAESVRKQVRDTQRRKAQDDLRGKARDARRPQPPAGGRAPAAREPERTPKPYVEDPMDALVDKHFGIGG